MNKLFMLGLVCSVAGCAGGAAEFATRPTPILCQQAQSLSPVYVYYQQLIDELNKRGADCAEFVGTGNTVLVR